MPDFDSRGPVIYRQDRTGRNGPALTLYEFRTMINNAEQDGRRFAAVDDSRITRVGKFLRKSHFDEIPQLWNVIRGDLSLVGSRPKRPVLVRASNR